MTDTRKTLDDLLLLGDPRLYEKAEQVEASELPAVAGWVQQLHEVMEAVRSRYGFGRGIAAPQLGIMKRIIYLNTDRPRVLINPIIDHYSDELFEVWDDCMCFPNLLVKVRRHRQIGLRYRDLSWQEHHWTVTDELSELIQHEYDHLEGVLCTMRAIDERAYRWRP